MKQRPHKLFKVYCQYFFSLAIILLIPSISYAQTTLSNNLVEQSLNRLSIFGIPILSMAGKNGALIFSAALVFIPLAFLIVGILILVSSLRTFKGVPREKSLAFGWNTVVKKVPLFGLVTIIVVLFSNLHLILSPIYFRIAPFQVHYFLESFNISFMGLGNGEQMMQAFFGFLFRTYIAAGVIQLSISVLEGSKGSLKYLFVSPKVFAPFFIGAIFYNVILTTGLIFLIIPGALFASTFYFWQFRLIDKGGSLIDAFRDSYTMTKGIRLEVFLFWFLTQVIALAGTAVVGVGFLISYPVSFLALAYTYNTLKSRPS